MIKLTARQEQVLALIKRHIEDSGYPPTRADNSIGIGAGHRKAGQVGRRRINLWQRSPGGRQRILSASTGVGFKSPNTRSVTCVCFRFRVRSGIAGRGLPSGVTTNIGGLNGEVVCSILVAPYTNDADAYAFDAEGLLAQVDLDGFKIGVFRQQG